MNLRLLLLVLVLSFCFSSAATYLRPWENHTWVSSNPYIWSPGVELWWNIPQFQSSLDQIEIPNQMDVNLSPSAKIYLNQTITRKAQTQAIKDQCYGGLARLVPEYLNFLMMPASGGVTSFIRTMDAVPSCVAYRDAWISTVDSATMLMEQSIQDAQASVADANREYESLKDLEICPKTNLTYLYVGSESCPDLKNALGDYSSGLWSIRHERVQTLHRYVIDTNSGLLNPSPDLSLFKPTILLVYGKDIGIRDTYAKVKQDAQNSMTEAKSFYDGQKTTITTQKSIAKQKFDSLDSEKVKLIKKAPTSTAYHEIGTINDRYNLLSGTSASLSHEFQLASLWPSAHSSLASEITTLVSVSAGYTKLSRNLDKLESDARDTVESQKEEAQYEISETESVFRSTTPSPEGADLLDQAKKSVTRGETTQTLGEQFTAFNTAAVLARTARTSGSFDKSLNQSASLNELRDLIRRTKIDNISVIGEEASLAIIEKLPAFDTSKHISAATDNIVSKAKLKYDNNLLTTQARIKEKLSLAGPDAADLITDLIRYDEGIFNQNGGIDYPNAIGRLLALRQNYKTLEATVDEYMSDIAGNSMSTTASPFISNVRLDEPASIRLDITLNNPSGYSARDAPVRIHLRKPVKFLASDVSAGSEDIESLYMADSDNTLVIILGQVKPYETRQISLEKSTVLAHSTKKTRSAIGIGYGRAQVSETIDFTLDTQIPGLSGYLDSLVDEASPQRTLEAGKHTLTTESTIDDAYSETTDNLRAFKVGLNSRVEYNIRIAPNTDLDSVIVFVNAMNDSRVSGFEMTSASGDGLKDKIRISENEYSVRITSLKKNRPSVLRVVYNVMDTDKYVADQIKRIDFANVSSDVRTLIDTAKTQVRSGDFIGALETIEKAKVQMNADEEAHAKLDKKTRDLEHAIGIELNAISSALQSDPSSNGTLANKLSVRKSELDALLTSTESMNLSDKVDALSKYDDNWLPGEINDFAKSSSKEFNDLKVRYFKLGNSTQPAEFSDFEAALSRLEAGMKPEYAVVAENALTRMRSLVVSREANQTAETQVRRSQFDALAAKVRNTLALYARELTTAKGGDYAGLFTESDKTVQTLLKDAEAAITKDPRIFALRMEDLISANEHMNLTLNTLSSEALAKISLLENHGVSADKLAPIRRLISEGSYIQALKSASALLDDQSTPSKSDNSLLLLGITALAVLGVVVVFIAKPKPQKKRELRPLAKAPSNLFNQGGSESSPETPSKPPTSEEPTTVPDPAREEPSSEPKPETPNPEPDVIPPPEDKQP